MLRAEGRRPFKDIAGGCAMSRRDCFGKLDKVFPMGPQGLRESPAECFRCPDRTECLRAALQTRDGVAVQEEAVDRAARSGALGFLKRWSRKKHLSRLARERGEA
jgi:hypothetical protein